MSSKTTTKQFRPQIALNPIQWMATDDAWLDPSIAPERRALLSLVKAAGFDAVLAEVPADWSVEQYLDTVGEIGLSLAPGHFVCHSDGQDGTEDEVLDSARRIAQQHRRLGMRDIGLGMGMRKDGPRLRHPARGHQADAERLRALTTLVGRIAEVMSEEGVRPALHPHVATWIETEAEGRAVLDAVPSDRLGFLPDTGHLAWAGADVRGFVADYAERVALVHVKDCRLSVAKQGQARDWDYQRTVLAGLWTEPGRGELPLEDIIGALPATFDGSLMVEVDRPDIPDPYESAQVSAAWMQKTYGSADAAG